MRPLIFLTALSVCGCSALKPFPAKRLWEYDSREKICAEYEITEHDPKLKFKHLRDVPLEQCPSIFGFTAKDVPKVLNWSEDALEYAKRKCK